MTVQRHITGIPKGDETQFSKIFNKCD